MPDWFLKLYIVVVAVVVVHKEWWHRERMWNSIWDEWRSLITLLVALLPARSPWKLFNIFNRREKYNIYELCRRWEADELSEKKNWIGEIKKYETTTEKQWKNQKTRNLIFIIIFFTFSCFSLLNDGGLKLKWKVELSFEQHHHDVLDDGCLHCRKMRAFDGKQW